MKNIYLIAGHNGRGTGAKGLNGTDEGEMTIELRDDVAKILESDGLCVTTDLNYLPLRGVLEWLKIVKPRDVVIDIHFNAFGSPNAHGTEVIISNDATHTEIKFAYDLQKAIVNALGTRDRGVKREKQTARKRLGMLSGTPRAAINVLLEVCFITNPEDLKRYDENYGKLIQNISEIIKNFVNLHP